MRASTLKENLSEEIEGRKTVLTREFIAEVLQLFSVCPHTVCHTRCDFKYPDTPPTIAVAGDADHP